MKQFIETADLVIKELIVKEERTVIVFINMQFNEANSIWPKMNMKF